MKNYKALLSKINTFVFDYDGVFTNGTVVLQKTGEPLRTANVKDGYAIQLANKLGYRIVIISGGKSESMSNRFDLLKVKDVFLGVPYNIASYALLTYMIASATKLEVGEFIHSLGDTHIYLNHMDQVEEQLKREPHSLPQLQMNKKEDLFDYVFEDFKLLNYESHPFISAPIAV